MDFSVAQIQEVSVIIMTEPIQVNRSASLANATTKQNSQN
jgi:hypothetical protein